MIVKLDFSGNPYIGVYCSANEGYLLCNPSVPGKVVKKVTASLEAESITTTIGGSTILGSLVRSNSKGCVVTDFVTDDEMAKMDPLKPVEINDKLNAVGNNILCNDTGAVIHPGFGGDAVRLIREALQVPVTKSTIAGLKTVGSVAVATNKGVVCHPKVRENEKKLLEEVLGVPASIATANYGTAYLGACVVANSRGAAVGSTTTPIEIGRIEDGLVLF